MGLEVGVEAAVQGGLDPGHSLVTNRAGRTDLRLPWMAGISCSLELGRKAGRDGAGEVGLLAAGRGWGVAWTGLCDLAMARHRGPARSGPLGQRCLPRPHQKPPDSASNGCKKVVWFKMYCLLNCSGYT